MISVWGAGLDKKLFKTKFKKVLLHLLSFLQNKRTVLYRQGGVKSKSNPCSCIMLFIKYHLFLIHMAVYLLGQSPFCLPNPLSPLNPFLVIIFYQRFY